MLVHSFCKAPLIARYRESIFTVVDHRLARFTWFSFFLAASSSPNRVKDPPQFVNGYHSSLIARLQGAVLIVWPYAEYLLRARRHKASLCLAALLIAYRHNSIFSPRPSAPHLCPFLFSHHTKRTILSREMLCKKLFFMTVILSIIL